jgi:hypothetical protein
MKFQNGRNLSSDTIAAIRYMAKVGAMSRGTWYALFGRGKLRWQQAQWKHLIDLRIFKHHPCGVISDVVVIGYYGLKMIKAQGWKYASGIYPHLVYHNERVALGLWHLEQAGLCKRWMTAGEMKASKNQAFKLAIKEKKFRFPDAVFTTEAFGNEQLFAVEFENKNQTYWRYRPLLLAYRRNSSFDRILFVVKDNATKKSLKMTLSRIGDAKLIKRIVLINEEKWINKPEELFMKIA